MFHVGSHLGAGMDAGLDRVVAALKVVLDRCSDTTWLLMENTAGTGATIGRSVEELALLFDRLERHPRLAWGFTWLAEQEPHTWALVESGRYAVGTVDSYLIARMTRGTWHVTDVSNACRTLLFDLESGDWSDELCELFGVPRDALPELVPNWGEVAPTDPQSFLGLSLPIAGIAGDQQSALFGQTCFEEGESKCTYGTGSFILTNTGSSVVRSDAGLLSTAVTAQAAEFRGYPDWAQKAFENNKA